MSRRQSVNRETEKNERMPRPEEFRANNDWTTNLFSGILERSENLTNDVLFATFVLDPQAVSAHIVQRGPSSGFIPAERHTNRESSSSWNRKDPALRSCYIEPGMRSVSALSMNANRRVSSDSWSSAGQWYAGLTLL